MSEDKICTWCGDALEEFELESPEVDSEGDIICDSCYREHFQFECALCQEYAPKDEEDHVFIVVEECPGSPDKVPPGIYQVIKYPFFTSDMISSWFQSSSLKRIAESPIDALESGYPSGQICKDCCIHHGWTWPSTPETPNV